jgi:hypothetical protein
MNSITISRMVGCVGLGLTLMGANAKADEHGFLFQGPSVIYTMDNAASANHVLVYRQDDRGALQSAGSVATGGTGTGSN